MNRASKRTGLAHEPGLETIRARSDTGQENVTSPGASRMLCIPPNGLKARTRTGTLEFSDEGMNRMEGMKRGMSVSAPESVSVSLPLLVPSIWSEDCYKWQLQFVMSNA